MHKVLFHHTLAFLLCIAAPVSFPVFLFSVKVINLFASGQTFLSLINIGVLTFLIVNYLQEFAVIPMSKKIQSKISKNCH